MHSGCTVCARYSTVCAVCTLQPIHSHHPHCAVPPYCNSLEGLNGTYKPRQPLPLQPTTITIITIIITPTAAHYYVEVAHTSARWHASPLRAHGGRYDHPYCSSLEGLNGTYRCTLVSLTRR